MSDGNYNPEEINDITDRNWGALGIADALDDVEVRRHITGIRREVTTLITTKYLKGQKEHGGHLWEMSAEELLDNAIDEAVDQLTYLLTLRRKQYGPRT